MEPDRKGLAAAGLAGAFALLLGAALAATGEWRTAAFLGAADAATAAAGPGVLDQLFEALIPDRLAEAGRRLPMPGPGAQGPAAGPTPEEAAAALAAARAAIAEAERLANCTGGDCAAPAEGGGTSAARPEDGSPEDAAASGEEEEARLELIRMRERSRGESRSYGGDAAARPQRPATQADLEASFGGMIQKLKSRAGSAPAAVGSADGPAGRGEASGGGDDAPILTLENQSGKLNSPTMRALQKLNKDSRHSVGMSRDAGTTDGSRDKAGKSFDGNRATFGAIPIAETTGAMGRKQIRAVEETAAPEIEGRPVP